MKEMSKVARGYGASITIVGSLLSVLLLQVMAQSGYGAITVTEVLGSSNHPGTSLCVVQSSVRMGFRR